MFSNFYFIYSTDYYMKYTNIIDNTQEKEYKPK